MSFDVCIDHSAPLGRFLPPSDIQVYMFPFLVDKKTAVSAVLFLLDFLKKLGFFYKFFFYYKFYFINL